jgi:alkylation response protein AidB-like acyl-CoA dehydrogenase
VSSIVTKKAFSMNNDAEHAVRRSGLLEQARAMAPLLSAMSAKHEAIGQLTDEALAALKDANFFGLMVPRALGGAGASAVEMLEVYEEVSRADASSGWVLTTCGFAAGLASVYLQDQAAASVFGAGMPIIAGSGAPQGRAVQVEGGYRLSGRWSYGSGIRHATHLHTGAFVHSGNERKVSASGQPAVYVFTPRIEVARLEGNWDVLGLRGTGSVDYEIADAFIEAGFEFPLAQTEPLRGGALYSLGAAGLSSLAHTGFALGLGRRALDEIAGLVRGGAGRSGALAASESFLEGYAHAEAQYRSARAFVYAVWRDIEAKLAGARQVATRDITLTHLSLNHMMSTSAAVADFAYANGGGVSLRDGPIQRCFRDIHAGAQHARVAPSYLRESGKELLDLVPDATWERGKVTAATSPRSV